MVEHLLAALFWDSLVGYPDWLYRHIGHPVSWMGRLIAAAESQLLQPRQAPTILWIRGGILLIALMAGSGLAAWAIQVTLRSVNFGWIGEILVAATLLSGRSLYSHVKAVAAALGKDDLAEGRARVARIVGRDVSQLDESGVCRAAIESLAENFADGVVGPAIAYLAFGLPGIVIYKAVSTADSMIGHRNDRYRDFGWAAARIDDVLNLVPARLTSVLIALAAGPRFGQAMVSAWRDARNHCSPNAGWPEASMAGALTLRLGGPRRYGNLDLQGAWIGNGRKVAQADDIDRALSLYLKAMAWIFVFLASGALAFS